MTYIAVTKKGGKEYFAEMESYREGDKVKKRTVNYYGVVDPRDNPDARPIVKRVVSGTRRFGDVALLQYAADKINMVETIDTYVPKRQGLSFGLELFLTVTYRLLGHRPSSTKLATWVKYTHVPVSLNFNPDRITDNTQQYMMDKLYDEKMHTDNISKIFTALYEKTLPLFGKEEDVFFYDITSTYFEGTCCPIAHLGYSRDGKDDKLQINIGMVMNGKYGIPMMTKVFEGNVSDPKTVTEMAYYTKFVLKKGKGLLIMDRGMDSEHNINVLDDVGYDYIVGVRSNHTFVKQLKKMTDPSSDDWEVFENKGQKIKLKQFVKNIFGKRRTVVIYYSPDTARSQSEKRRCRIEFSVAELKETDDLTLKKAKKIVHRVRKYVIVEETSSKITWHVDQIAINHAEKNDGKFCIISKTAKKISPSETYRLYFSKDAIEKCFMHMKQDVNLHPTRKRDADHVTVDVFICTIGFLLLKIVERLAQKEKINGFWDELSTEAGEIGLIEYKNNNSTTKFQIVPNSSFQREIVDKLELSRYAIVPSTLPD
ncbi:MAG: IS1634 family transposase [Rhabdochlamydiaceae bacterium]